MHRAVISTHPLPPARRARPASVIAATLAVTIGLLTPGPAGARSARHPRSVANLSSAHQSCAPKHHDQPSSHKRSPARCAKRRTAKNEHRPVHRSPASTGAGGGSAAGPSEGELPPAEVTGATTASGQDQADGEAPGEQSGGGPSEQGAGGSSEPGSGGPSEQGGGSSTERGGSALEQGESSGGTLTDPIDPRYLTETPFGTTSFWIQPWRAYLDTWPASRLEESLGINFNVSAPQAEATARLLQDSGFKLARIAHQLGRALLRRSDPVRRRSERAHAPGSAAQARAAAADPARRQQRGPRPGAAGQPGNDRRKRRPAPRRSPSRPPRSRGRARQDRLRRALLRRRPRHPDHLGRRRGSPRSPSRCPARCRPARTKARRCCMRPSPSPRSRTGNRTRPSRKPSPAG